MKRPSTTFEILFSLTRPFEFQCEILPFVENQHVHFKWCRRACTATPDGGIATTIATTAQRRRVHIISKSNMWAQYAYKRLCGFRWLSDGGREKYANASYKARARIFILCISLCVHANTLYALIQLHGADHDDPNQERFGSAKWKL